MKGNQNLYIKFQRKNRYIKCYIIIKCILSSYLLTTIFQVNPGQPLSLNFFLYKFHKKIVKCVIDFHRADALPAFFQWCRSTEENLMIQLPPAVQSHLFFIHNRTTGSLARHSNTITFDKCKNMMGHVYLGSLSDTGV